MKNLVYKGILSGLLAVLSCNSAKQDKAVTTNAPGKDTTINVNDILFTIPTIENTFPGFENEPDSSGLSILKDDWRQIEFISKDQKKSIEIEMDSIHYIIEHESHKGQGYVGFNQIHVRKLITKPLSISFDKVFDYLGDSDSKVPGLNILNNSGAVKNGFSFICKGVKYYGLKDDKANVTALCIYGAESDAWLQNSLKKISKFLKSENLFIVNWLHIKVFDENNLQELVADFESK